VVAVKNSWSRYSYTRSSRSSDAARAFGADQNKLRKPVAMIVAGAKELDRTHRGDGKIRKIIMLRDLTDQEICDVSGGYDALAAMGDAGAVLGVIGVGLAIAAMATGAVAASPVVAAGMAVGVMGGGYFGCHLCHFARV